MKTETLVRSSVVSAAFLAGLLYLVWFWVSAFTVLADATGLIASRIVS